MNKRTLLIVAGLAVPVIALAVLVESNSHESNVQAASRVQPGGRNATPQMSLQQMQQTRGRVKARLAYLQTLTPAQWPAERRKNPRIPATLQQAIANNQNHLQQLNAKIQQLQQQQPRAQQTMAPVAPPATSPNDPTAPVASPAPAAGR